MNEIKMSKYHANELLDNYKNNIQQMCLKHYNHNHDALGRFSGSSSGRRDRAARKGLNKLYKLDKKANKHFAKRNKRYIVARGIRQTYHKYKYDEFGRGVIGQFLIPGTSSRKKAERYAKKLQKRIGSKPVNKLNSKQIYVGRAYCLTFVE